MTARVTNESTGMALVDRFNNRSSAAGIRGPGALIVLAATVTMAMGFGGLGLITVFMNPMEADFSWSRSDTSLGYALSTAGMAIGGLFWGRLSDRMDLRILLAIGATGMVASLLAMSLLQSLLVFYIAHVVYGGFGFSGLVTAGGALGQGLLPYFASFLINAFGWRWAFVGVGGTLFAALALALPVLRWPQGTRAPVPFSAGTAEASKARSGTVAILALAAFLCCMCMGVPIVHIASFISAVCGSPNAGVNSLVIAMVAGAVGRVCCGVIADRIGPLKAYAIASLIQTACVIAFPALENGWSFMALSVIFGFGFAGNMTCLSLCVRQAVPANRFGAAIGAVMMVAWAGMAVGGYMGGVLFDFSRSYTLSFLLAGVAGVLNLAVIGALTMRKPDCSTPVILEHKQDLDRRYEQNVLALADTHGRNGGKRELSKRTVVEQEWLT
jgi:predicted MFS family arabinose efflux permease